MRAKFILGLLVGVLYVLPASAQTFKDFIKDAEFVSEGKCQDREGVFHCVHFIKNKVSYLLYYKKTGEPYRIIQKEDGIVVWVATGTEV
jgi:hypothetical protein